MDVNQVTLLGRLGRDPECRNTQAGELVVNMSVATSEKWKNRQGEPKERTEWTRCVAFGHNAEFAQKYLKKGARVFIQGQLQTRKWQDQSGQDRWSTEVILNDFNGKLIAASDPPKEAAKPAEPAYGSHRGESAPADDMSDEIPF